MISKAVFCPVGNHAKLGELLKGEVCAFVCRECEWIFTWDRKGKLMPPIKLNSKKNRPIRYCDSNGCYCHD